MSQSNFKETKEDEIDLEVTDKPTASPTSTNESPSTPNTTSNTTVTENTPETKANHTEENSSNTLTEQVVENNA